MYKELIETQGYTTEERLVWGFGKTLALTVCSFEAKTLKLQFVANLRFFFSHLQNKHFHRFLEYSILELKALRLGQFHHLSCDVSSKKAGEQKQTNKDGASIEIY